MNLAVAGAAVNFNWWELSTKKNFFSITFKTENECATLSFLLLTISASALKRGSL
jgi:hypothetical protein